MKQPVAAVLAFAGATSFLCARQDDAAGRRVAELLQQAAAAEGMGNAAEAESLLRAALDAAPADARAVTALGRFLCAQDQGAEGLALLYRALELDPGRLEAVLALADALLAERDWYFEQGDAGNADAQLTRARELLDGRVRAGIGSRELDLRRVRVLSRGDDGAAEAFAIARALVTAEPGDQESLAALVDAATAARTFDEALELLARAGSPPWLEAWFSASTRAARATWNFNHYGDDELAVQDYLAADALVLAAARMNPEVFEAASERASFYRSWAGWVRYTRQQRTEEAWDLFMSAHGRNPDNDNAIEGLAWVGARLYEAGDLAQARELYRQACTIAPERSDFWNNYGLLCRDTGQFEESFRAYRRGMALSPDDPRIVNDCALILQYHLHRDLDLAERWYIEAEDLSRARLEAARRDGDEGAIGEQRLVLGDVLTNLARLFADQGRMQESAEHWNELREVDATRPELPENGGELNLPGSTANPPPPGSEAAKR